MTSTLSTVYVLSHLIISKTLQGRNIAGILSF